MNTVDESERSEIEELLPWHAAGTLDARDARRVEAALAGDPELARRYELAREELAQTIHLNETLGAPSPRVMGALFAKIDAEPVRSARLPRDFGARISTFFVSLSPLTLAWSASAAALVILVQAGVIAGVMLQESTAGSYETAAAPNPAASEGVYVLMRFKPDATAAAVTGFLEANKLSIASGPAAGGLYRVRVAGTGLPRSDLDRLMARLQADNVVDFIALTQ